MTMCDLSEYLAAYPLAVYVPAISRENSVACQGEGSWIATGVTQSGRFPFRMEQALQRWTRGEHAYRQDPHGPGWGAYFHSTLVEVRLASKPMAGLDAAMEST
jgi:hypothetical protein